MKNISNISKLLILIFSLFSLSSLYADDMDDVEAVINMYIDFETYDGIDDQAELMASDRTYIVNGVRYSNNDRSMELQNASNRVSKRAFPGAVRITTVEDIKIRINGDAAIASFYRVINNINNADSVKAGATVMNSMYQTVSMALFKRDGDWKIVHTHISPTINN